MLCPPSALLCVRVWPEERAWESSLPRQPGSSVLCVPGQVTQPLWASVLWAPGAPDEGCGGASQMVPLFRI